jgi:hypothetical protein
MKYMASLIKTTTLQDSDFVKQNAANTKLTNSPFGHSGTKILDRFKNTFPVKNKKYSPFLSQKDKG